MLPVLLDVACIRSVSVCGAVMAVSATYWPVIMVHAFITQILREQFGHVSEAVQSAAASA